ncbi:phage integrase SAM-like domain-containing protein [Dysgonomonas sp. GY75]|uniref:tyrosine-type recombinase/integrase n=1 Tax=Dysgonomonas sp. GY75 TaxID=2780419 RepID=UPI001883387E|nr:phage integrase SAM-like domain-containing protein [Dysgonomonas sp. GY75]MBF0649137.1 phage integrase SAM-like domain-containing protein [Dysgonomonas sp. GY75]
MATFKAEVQNKRADGTYNVRIRVTHNREIRRMSTNLYVTGEDLTRSLKIKNVNITEKCDELIKKCRKVCNDLGFELFDIPIDELVAKIKKHLQGKDKFYLDFVQYTKNKASNMKKGTGDTYLNMLSALKRFVKREKLDISEINTNFLREFEQFIATEPSQRGNNRKKAKKEPEAKGGRAVSKYLACVRAMHNMAKEEFNDEDRGIINIPFSPFKKYKLKPQPKTRKRALPLALIQQIINLPYEKEIIGGRTNRFNLAKDCFILSFALVGMNSADMFYSGLPKKNIIIYNREKTEGRRDDGAEMRVRIESYIIKLIDKYRDDKKLFRFHRHYSNHAIFNAAINKGLKRIGKQIGAEDLEFYAARHSWATIARSSAVGIDKYTVHEGLNHASNKDMKVTDIYIDKDWTVIWEANKKVLGLFDWTFLNREF